MTNTKEALRTALKPFAEIGAKKANKPNCGKFTLVTVEACRRAAEAYAALEAASTDGEGWVRVPREPTEAMLIAWTNSKPYDGDYTDDKCATACWKDMVDASQLKGEKP